MGIFDWRVIMMGTAIKTDAFGDHLEHGVVRGLYYLPLEIVLQACRQLQMVVTGNGDCQGTSPLIKQECFLSIMNIAVVCKAY